MGLVNSNKIIVAALLNAESADPPAYLGFGTGTTPAVRADTELEAAAGSRMTFYERGTQGGVGYGRVVIGGAATDKHYSIREFGTYSALTGSNVLYRRDVIEAVTPATNKIVTIDVLDAVAPQANDAYGLVTQATIDAVAAFLAGDSTPGVPVGSHLAVGTALRIDKADSLSAWTTLTDTEAAVLDTNKYVEGTASIQAAKTVTSNTDFGYTATFGAIDTTSYDYYRMYFRVADADTLSSLSSVKALRVRAGTGASSYKEYTLPRDNLIVGWQLLNLRLADFTDVGAPTMSAVTRLDLIWQTELASNTIVSNKMWFDYPHLSRPLAYDAAALVSEIDRNALTSAPGRTRVNESVRYPARFETSEANPYQLEQFGLFDAAASGTLIVQGRTPVIQKNSNVQVVAEARITVNIEDQ